MSTEATAFEYPNHLEMELLPKADDYSGFVYVLLFRKDDLQVPFYVGQTTRFYGRMDDYFWASFQAPTDFKVGEAIRYLCGTHGGKVYAKYWKSIDRFTEEKNIEQRLRTLDTILLNGGAYACVDTDADVERPKVRARCDLIVASLLASGKQA